MPTGLAQPWEGLIEEEQDASLPSRSRYLLGLVFILLQCLVWIVAAVLTQGLYETSASEQEEEEEVVEDWYNDDAMLSPFLLTYIGMSIMALLLPLRSFTEHLRGCRSSCQTALVSDDGICIESKLSYDSVDERLQTAQHFTDYVDIARCSANQLSTDKVRKWNHRKHILAAAFLTPAMFIADWTFNMALVDTSVASAAILLSTQSVFVLVMAVVTRLETFSLLKLFGVLACMAGTALTALDDATEDDKSEARDALRGDVMAVVAAMAYAAYTIQVRIYCPDNEELYSMELLLGYIGMFCFVFLLPLGAYFIWLQMDSLTLFAVTIIVVKGMLDFCITDYCLFRAIVLTNATLATVGLGLTIPMAFFADWILGKADAFSHYGLLGALAVSIGFLVVNLAPEEAVKQPEKESLNEEAESPHVEDA